jgi:tRNA pseudouridine65 synthase
MFFRLLYQDEYIVAIDKPAGFHVHPPEGGNHPISRNLNCLYLLRRQIDNYLYPIHRIDRSTSGVLLFALNPNAARTFCELFSQQKITKSYYCVVRGWIENQGLIDYPLKSKSNPTVFYEASSYYQKIAQIELPHAIGRYPSARYSLARVYPITGRFHQIRRHFAHLSHPLIGDTVYGNGEHNRFFRSHFLINTLLLKAQSVSFSHPFTGKVTTVTSKWTQPWHKIFDMFGICPTSYDTRYGKFELKDKK